MTESEAIKEVRFNMSKIGLSDKAAKRVVEARNVAIKALEKQIPKKPKSTHIKYGKHTWAKKENGEIDDFAWDYEYHNGVVCEVCGKTVCVHCNPQYDRLTDCEDEYYNCPSCGKKIFSAYKYCDCGQKIDWSDEECAT